MSQTCPSGCARLAPVVTPLAPRNSLSHRAADADKFGRRVPIDKPILESLVIPLAMVVIDEFLECPSKVALAERHHSIDALVFDRPYEPFGIGVRIGT